MSVKDKKRGRPKGATSHLNGQVIIDMAKCIMREEGKIPSIRQLASRLDVDAMAIYHYFKNKNTLLVAITTSLVEDIYQPKVNDDWQSELRQLCRSYLSLLNDFPGLLETLLSMDSAGPATVFIERFEQVMAPLNLDATASKNALDLLVDYLHGYALALNCNGEKSTLNIDMLDGPLNLYCSALDTMKNID
ncbi:TetR/AcrR family transcriptional regulator [Photobacterium sp. SDRW27]|uniref:TetR/AcrR family transcriptional regulator n=1 Tax=Photobacterium obscurum TaxID=2829490 RepID=UPI0022444D47|nr:TetR/AcrR family transcriptional regulator [Photobacterium obscurum]MCW8328936.1 TetR/AcrR family transcriptional regulator [Photobacterium obscurum]